MMIAALLLAAAAPNAPSAHCALEGWSVDRDPAGLRVHAGPGIATREIGRLPAAVDEEDSYAPTFDIVDVRDGWVRIARANDFENPVKPRPTFAGTGWVHASRIAFTVQSGVGRARADRTSPAIVRADDWLGDAGNRVQPILACAGGWARLRYRFPQTIGVQGPRSGEAWFGGICGNQHTTCDGKDETKSPPGK